MKNQKGITLIALVITIIVLLILAGVSIAMLTGQNGILTRAQGTGEATIVGEVEETIKLAVSEITSNKLDPATNTQDTIDVATVAALMESNNKNIKVTADSYDTKNSTGDIDVTVETGTAVTVKYTHPTSKKLHTWSITADGVLTYTKPA